MKRLSLVFSVLAVAAPIMAAPPEVKPTLATCKVDLKEWSQQKTETLTITQLNERMNIMFACADVAKKHEKQARSYLDEFYRTHAELANRAFNFITKHGLTEEFGAEENGSPAAQTLPPVDAREKLGSRQ